jgi:hypothetical protein
MKTRSLELNVNIGCPCCHNPQNTHVHTCRPTTPCPHLHPAAAVYPDRLDFVDRVLETCYNVSLRERERERECVCVCVCVCWGEGEGRGERICLGQPEPPVLSRKFIF